LPSLRGPCPVFWALVEQRRQVGVTIHVIESTEIDAGPILAQLTIVPDVQQSVAELTSALFLASIGLLRNAAERLVQGQYPCTSGSTSGSAQSGDYRGFPTRLQMATARAQRLRLCRLAHLSSLMCGVAGFVSHGSD
jgi:methionyl-tRNA formyltransferase